MLTFEKLRSLNQTRCVNDFAHSLAMWSVAEWGNATAGECGEACNVAKKLIRIRDGIQNISSKTEQDYKQELADEIADMVLYADLWAAAAGISLEEAIIKKFNEVSRKRNSLIKL